MISRNPTMENLVCRLQTDMRLLSLNKNNKKIVDMLSRRIIRHKDDIAHKAIEIYGNQKIDVGSVAQTGQSNTLQNL